jgi:hypothetical protein
LAEAFFPGIGCPFGARRFWHTSTPAYTDLPSGCHWRAKRVTTLDETRSTIEEGAPYCDSHAHICGPVSRFRYADERIYTPPDALAPDYVRLLKAIGGTRAVLVQPSVYGAENTVLLAALKDIRASGIDCRGVAVIDKDVMDEELARLNDAGIRGIRFNLVDVANPKTGLPLDDMRALCARIAALDSIAALDRVPTRKDFRPCCALPARGAAG